MILIYYLRTIVCNTLVFSMAGCTGTNPTDINRIRGHTGMKYCTYFRPALEKHYPRTIQLSDPDVRRPSQCTHACFRCTSPRRTPTTLLKMMVVQMFTILIIK